MCAAKVEVLIASPSCDLASEADVKVFISHLRPAAVALDSSIYSCTFSGRHDSGELKAPTTGYYFDLGIVLTEAKAAIDNVLVAEIAKATSAATTQITQKRARLELKTTTR
jgi:hypothetical protein